MFVVSLSLTRPVQTLPSAPGEESMVPVESDVAGRARRAVLEPKRIGLRSGLQASSFPERGAI